MYRGFELKLASFPDGLDRYEVAGQAIASEADESLAAELDSHRVPPLGLLSGQKLADTWFPTLTCDVFISHSSKDKRLARSLGGLLSVEFGLVPFIDGCLWGRADDLLRSIDDQNCRKPDGYYSYEKRNQSTAHVHILLTTALTAMLDSSECVLFLNTPNATAQVGPALSTESPWIFAELEISRRLRRQLPVRWDQEELKKGMMKEARAMMTHMLEVSHLNKITLPILNAWMNENPAVNRGPAALDTLYRLVDADFS